MLPGLSQLERSPEIFRILLDGLTEEEAAWKPSPNRWSIAEVMEHLSHAEGHGFRARVDVMVEHRPGDPLPHLEEYNQEKLSAAGQYSGRDIEDSFDHWEEQRETNVEFLRSLEDGVVTRKAQHEVFGTITLSDLLNEWAFHDMGHIRQVIELLRSFRFYPRMGPFRAIYAIHP